MQPVFADPKTDFVFRRIFGAESRKPLLIALLGRRAQNKPRARNGAFNASIDFAERT